MYFGASAMAKPSFFSSDLVQVLLCPRLHELQFAVKALLAGGLACTWPSAWSWSSRNGH